MLERRATRVTRERSSRKEPLRDADVRALLRRVRSVIVAKSKKVTRLSAAEAGLRDLKGPTGNYRAPMILKGDVLLVGFNAEALDELL